jgi:phenylalanyl-tRNA synthetase beta chain
MKVLLSWIREFVDVDEPAEDIGRRLSLRGLALEGIEHLPALRQPPLAAGAAASTAPDAVLDFDVTANRPDCLSMAGIAREIAVAYRRPFKDPRAEQPLGTAPPASGASIPNGLPVSIADPDLCGRYVGAVADVTIGPSPGWLADRLSACGIRPISNVVDITNYVLLELGQPMHAFDHAKLAGPAIIVRRARRGEALRTLDGRQRTLSGDMLVIADAERAVAIGGVMGGADSEVSDRTRRIVFEAAWFKPQSVRTTSRALGLRTEASMRFERGADPDAALVATARANELLIQTGAGSPVGGAIDVHPRPYQARTLLLAHPRVSGLLGMNVPDKEVVAILTALGFSVTRAPGGWSAVVPSWRIDMYRDVDLIEEVGRHYGFEHLPATFPAVWQPPPPSDPRIGRDKRARDVALASGFSEAISFAFVEGRHAEPFLGNDPPVALANPLSETFAVMRPSLVPGLVAAVSHNRRHGRRDVQLFEIGTRFSTRGELRSIALAWTGLAAPEHWAGERRDVDFFDVKGAVDALAGAFDVELGWQAPAPESVAHAVLVEGRAAELVLQQGDHVTPLGWAGQLAAFIGETHELPSSDALFVAELDLDCLSAASPAAARLARPLPRVPAVVRDIAMLVDDTLSAATVRGTIRAAAPETLVSIMEFDRYQGQGVPDGKVSLAIRLTFQSAERTLTDAEVQESTEAVVRVLERELGAVQR